MLDWYQYCGTWGLFGCWGFAISTALRVGTTGMIDGGAGVGSIVVGGGAGAGGIGRVVGVVV